MKRKRAVVWVAAILSIGALAGCSAEDHRMHAHAVPIAVLAYPRVSGRPSRTHPHATWLIDPDEPLPRNSRWGPVLAVAHRFATADLSYEVGELGPAVRRTITSTCTAAFAAALFAHRASLPPGVSRRQVSQRLVGVQPLDRVHGAAVVLATVRSNGHGRAPGTFELRLVPRPGGWRVAGLSVV